MKIKTKSRKKDKVESKLKINEELDVYKEKSDESDEISIPKPFNNNIYKFYNKNVTEEKTTTKKVEDKGTFFNESSDDEVKIEKKGKDDKKNERKNGNQTKDLEKGKFFETVSRNRF